MMADRCRVVRFEPRGCGRSDWDGLYTVDTLIDDAAAILRAYAVETCIVAGHSFGSNVALAYALRHPAQVMGLVAIAGGQLVNDRSWSEIYRRNLKEVGEDRGGMMFDADARVNAEGNRSWRSFIRRPSLFRDVAALPIFATFVTAANDIRPNWPIQQLAALLPNGHCVEIEGAAHYAWLTHAAELRHELCLAIDRIQSR